MSILKSVFVWFLRRTIMTKFKSLLGSRRFWAGVAGMVVILADTFFGEGTVNPETVTNVVMILGAWIVGDSLRETVAVDENANGAE